MHKPNFDNVVVSILVAYAVLYSGVVLSRVGRDLNLSLNSWSGFGISHSEYLGMAVGIIGVAVSSIMPRLCLPLTITISYVFVTVMLVPFADGPMCLHHGPEFDPGLFLFGGFGAMGVFGVVILVSWVRFVKYKAD